MSGGPWAADGFLYLSGLDRPELYRLRLPKAGMILEHAGTLPWSTQGQAIGSDPSDPHLLWSIDRATRAVVATRVTL